MAGLTPSVTVVGAGVAGLCVATELAARGRAVRLVDRGGGPGPHGCSWWAGGMLAPFCEGERAEEPVVRLGRLAADWWERHAGGVTRAGTLVVALGRDRAELDRFARRTEGHEALGADRIGELEPDLEGRFGRALFFADEAHLDPRRALATLVDRLAGRGVAIEAGDVPGAPPPHPSPEGRARACRADPHGSAGPAFPSESEEGAVAAPSDVPSPPSGGRDGDGGTTPAPPTVVDCRGLAARDALRDLRGVKGEMVVLRCPEVRLGRPVRLLHPRAPLYIVPRGDGVYMLGATVIETAERGRVTARSMLELLSAAYALHPAYGEAEVLEIGVDARPAFPDNLPRIRGLGGTIYANGLYRHGFLLGPALAVQVADLLFDGKTPEFSDEHHAERGAA
jgi:glycine oxidase